MEAVIGCQKTEGRLDRNFLRGVFGDKANALLVGIGYNLRAILRKLRLHFCLVFWPPWPWPLGLKRVLKTWPPPDSGSEIMLKSKRSQD
ncbi:MAG: hypothetical protein H7831_00710 [Magnetococcus sp. WYHC-3]